MAAAALNGPGNAVFIFNFLNTAPDTISDFVIGQHRRLGPEGGFLLETELRECARLFRETSVWRQWSRRLERKHGLRALGQSAGDLFCRIRR
jgi:hypothetical protein